MEHIITYRGQTISLTDEQYDALASYGAEVAAGDLTAEEAVRTVLCPGCGLVYTRDDLCATCRQPPSPEERED
jgi:hypothetical protein